MYKAYKQNNYVAFSPKNKSSNALSSSRDTNKSEIIHTNVHSI